MKNEIALAQAEYAARPYAVRWSWERDWVDSHFETTNRFSTLEEAFKYAQDMWAIMRQEVSRRRYMASNIWRSRIETPNGKIPLAYYLLADDVSSY